MSRSGRDQALKWLAAASGLAALVLLWVAHVQRWPPERATAVTGPAFLLTILLTLLRPRRKAPAAATDGE